MTSFELADPCHGRPSKRGRGGKLGLGNECVRLCHVHDIIVSNWLATISSEHFSSFDEDQFCGYLEGRCSNLSRSPYDHISIISRTLEILKTCRKGFAALRSLGRRKSLKSQMELESQAEPGCEDVYLLSNLSEAKEE